MALIASNLTMDVESKVESIPLKFNPQVDYVSSDKTFVIIRFIVECGKFHRVRQ